MSKEEAPLYKINARDRYREKEPKHVHELCWYVDGPGMGGYYGGFGHHAIANLGPVIDDMINPPQNFPPTPAMEQTAKLMCLAYREGYLKAQDDIRKALGIERK